MQTVKEQCGAVQNDKEKEYENENKTRITDRFQGEQPIDIYDDYFKKYPNLIKIFIDYFKDDFIVYSALAF